jgi:hypothetical protein
MRRERCWSCSNAPTCSLSASALSRMTFTGGPCAARPLQGLSDPRPAAICYCSFLCVCPGSFLPLVAPLGFEGLVVRPWAEVAAEVAAPVARPWAEVSAGAPVARPEAGVALGARAGRPGAGVVPCQAAPGSPCVAAADSASVLLSTWARPWDPVWEPRTSATDRGLVRVP